MAQRGGAAFCLGNCFQAFPKSNERQPNSLCPETPHLVSLAPVRGWHLAQSSAHSSSLKSPLAVAVQKLLSSIISMRRHGLTSSVCFPKGTHILFSTASSYF